jgi:tryptophan synthase alpha chain
LGDLVSRVRQKTSLPVCVGFGIGTPQQASAVGSLADGVIIGSACVRTIGESKVPVQAAKEFAEMYHVALISLKSPS